MIYKKRTLIISFFLIIFIHLGLYVNNNQKSSFRFFIWNFQEIKIGKIISLSFFSGLLISSILNNTKYSYFKNNKIIEDVDNEDEYYDQIENEAKNNSIFEMPPQRDVRDTQPTISVNYRVVKNKGESNLESGSTNNSKYQDDWTNDETDW